MTVLPIVSGMAAFPFVFPILGAHYPWTVLGLIAVFIVVFKLSRAYWGRRLARWAETQQLKMVRFRGARFWEGPSAWMRSRNQQVFRVVTRDREGRERTCWIMFGTYWGFTWGKPLSKVVWDDEKA